MAELVVFFPLRLVSFVKILGLFVESKNFCISFVCLLSFVGGFLLRERLFFRRFFVDVGRLQGFLACG
jgi:hypothetical protein